MSGDGIVKQLLSLPPNVLKMMGFSEPASTHDTNGVSTNETTAEAMLKNLLFDDDRLPAVPQQHKASDLSPCEAFSLLHANGPQYFVRDNFLGRAVALKLRDTVRALRDKGALRPAGMGKGGAKV